MEENIVPIQNAFWQNVQSEVWVALDQFRQSGRRLTKKFIDSFRKQTHLRVTDTCQRYINESKRKLLSSMAKTATKAETSKVEDVKNVSKATEQPKKRQNEGTSSSTQPPFKKQRKAELKMDDHGSDDKIDIHDDLLCTTFFCVHCLDDKNPAKSFSGTIDDVYSHWLAKHADELLSKPFNFYAVASVGCFYCKKGWHVSRAGATSRGQTCWPTICDC
ncbi:uncharacterized protein LOC129565942 [Sitodiplosis mosellana]|uniref:uncharacterized protein LOC129565942 n=1 Tax=Sitodiplosis mosellana TaxID=263140 RepID=UPI002443B64F|nr:uncharacterized protein LOC129565942 [Sitodiplosis mosellana]